MNARKEALLFAALTLATFFGIAVGDVGIARMRWAEIPPFHAGLYTFVVSLPWPPQRLLLAWDSHRSIGWMSCVGLTAFGGVRRVLAGWLLTAVSAMTAVFFGLWMWLFAALHAHR